MIENWIYTVPGSLIITAILSWPVSKQGSPVWLERIAFILSSMVGVELLIWGFQQNAGGINNNLDTLNLVGPTVSLVAVAFLLWLWFDKVVGIVSDLLLGRFETMEPTRVERDADLIQIEQAVRLYRAGRHQRALNLCCEIVESNSHYTTAALTLADWIENHDGLRVVKNPRSKLTFRGEYSHLNWLLAF